MRSAAPALLLAGALAGRSAGAAVQEPGAGPLEFRGPGRDAPEPEVKEVVLGFFGPGDPEHTEYGEFWRGATLALEQENAAGGWRGKPFRLEAAWSESPWAAGIAGVTRLVYDRGAWAVIGGVDGTTTHLAVQLALKSYFLLLSPGSTDVTADRANVPWLFSLPPSDARMAPVLAEAVAAAGGSFAVVAGTDHDSHAQLVALRRALGARRLSPVSVQETPGEREGLAAVVTSLLERRPRAIAVLGPAQLSAAVVRASRAAGFEGVIVGGPAAAREAFARAAGAAAEGVRVPAWIEPDSAKWTAFDQDYAGRWHARPDWAAASSYDALRLVAAALRRGGLNRVRLRDAVRELAPYAGASGVVRWDARGRNEPAVHVSVWQGGRLQPLP